MESIGMYLEALPDDIRYAALFLYILVAATGFTIGVVDVALFGTGLLCRFDLLSFAYTLPIALLATAIGETLIFLAGNSLKSTVMRIPLVKRQLKNGKIAGRIRRLHPGNGLRCSLLIRCMPTVKAFTLLVASGVLLDRKTYFSCYLPVSLACSLLTVSLPFLLGLLLTH